MNPGFPAAASAIVSRRQSIEPSRALLVGISGIGGSGKGFVTHQISTLLADSKYRCAILPGDDWLDVRHRRTAEDMTPEAYYAQALRSRELLEVILPLKAQRRIDATYRRFSESEPQLQVVRVQLEEIDIILLEGIFLFRPDLREHFDVRIWVNCSFERALERARARGQESLPAEETSRLYTQLFHPAQKLHLARDMPLEHADLVIQND